MNIPIIGQPAVEDWFVALQIKCPCGAQFQLVGQPGSMRACKGSDGRGAGCNRIYRMDAIPVVQQDGQPGGTPVIFNADGSLSAGLGVAVARKE